MENQENVEIVEEVVETEVKTKWYKSGWFKGALLTVGGIALGAAAAALVGDSGNQDGDTEEVLLEGDTESTVEMIDVSDEVKTEEV